MTLIRFLATGCGAGLSPYAPGTFGTLVAIPIVMLLGGLPPLVAMVITLAFVFFSVFVSELNERASGMHDQGEVVIDEIAGYMVTLLWLPCTMKFLAAGFCLFRLFDIVKPWPISQIDRDLKGGLGVVMDDIAAGIISNLILQIIYVKTDWLGVQWHH